MSKPKPLPEEVFTIMTLLLADVIRLLERSDLNSPELFALLHLRHRGVNYGEGRLAYTQEHYSKVLKREFGYTPAAVDVHLRKMEGRGWIQRQRLSPDEKMAVFKTRRGRMGVVIFLPKGGEKIEEVKQNLNTLYINIVSQLPRPTQIAIGVAIPKMKGVMMQMIAVLQKRERLRESIPSGEIGAGL